MELKAFLLASAALGGLAVITALGYALGAMISRRTRSNLLWVLVFIVPLALLVLGPAGIVFAALPRPFPPYAPLLLLLSIGGTTGWYALAVVVGLLREIRQDRSWCRQIATALSVDPSCRLNPWEEGGHLKGVDFSLEGKPGNTVLTLRELRVPLTVSWTRSRPPAGVAQIGGPEAAVGSDRSESDELLFVPARQRETLRSFVLDPSVLAVSAREGALQLTLTGSEPDAIARRVLQAVEQLGPLFRPIDERSQLLTVFAEDPSPALRLVALHQLVQQREPTLSTLLDQAAGSELPELRAYVALHRLDASALAAAAGEGGLALPEVLAGTEVYPGLAYPREELPARREIGLILLSAELPAARALGARFLESVGRPDDQEAERALLVALEGASVEVAGAVLGALGSVGSHAAVPALVRGLSMKGHLRTRALSALRAVQARLTGVEAGAIQLVEEQAEEGAIRISTQGGEVALVDEAPPRPRPVPQRQG